MLERYYKELLNFCARRVKDRDAAADVVQESYVRVLAAQQAGRAIRQPRALLYRTARNVLIDQHRRADVRDATGAAEWAGQAAGALDGARDGAFDGAHGCAGPQAWEPDAMLSSQQGLAAMVATIDQLPPRCREAFMLYKFDGLSYAAIAQQMGISTRTVEMQLQIAMKACWRCLDEINGAGE